MYYVIIVLHVWHIMLLILSSIHLSLCYHSITCATSVLRRGSPAPRSPPWLRAFGPHTYIYIYIYIYHIHVYIMYRCMYVCIYIYIHIYIYIYICIHIHTYIHAHIYVCISLSLYIYICTHTCIRIRHGCGPSGRAVATHPIFSYRYIT